MYPKDGLTLAAFERGRLLPRFCKTLEQMNNDFSNVVTLNNASKCKVCCDKTIWQCTLCNKNLCTMSKQTWDGAKCILAYHNEEFYGLARSDFRSVHGKNVESWTPSDTSAISRNVRRSRRYVAEIQQEGRGSA